MFVKMSQIGMSRLLWVFESFGASRVVQHGSTKQPTCGLFIQSLESLEATIKFRMADSY